MFPFWFLVYIFFSIAIVLASNQLWIPAFLLVTGLLLFGVYNRSYSREAFTGGLVIMVGLLYFSLLTTPAPEHLPEIKPAQVEGIVKDYPRYDGKKTTFAVRTNSKNRYSSNVQVYCNFDAHLQKGDQVEIKGSLKQPSRAGNPGEFDYRKYLEKNGIYYIFSVKEEEKDLSISRQASGFQGWINSYRYNSQELVKEVLPPDEAAILLGMLLGIIEGIDSSEYSDYQKTGVVHIFSVSGLHVGFLLLLCAWVCSLLGLSRKTRVISGILLLLIYATLVGWPVPVIRSVIMGSIGLIAFYSGRDNRMLNSLGLAGIVILLINPNSLLQITFQLSFAAAWGLVYLFPLLRRKLNYSSRWGDLLLVPICAQLAVLPLTAYHFHLFSPLALLANIPITYLSGGAVILGFLSLLTGGLLPGLSALFLYPAGLCIDLIRIVNELVVNIPGSYLRVVAPGAAFIVLFYAGLLLSIYAFTAAGDKKRTSVLATGLVMIAVFVTVICLPGSIYNRGKLEVTFIDVGQGDSILIKTPRGKFILVDGGGSDFSDPGTRKVLPYLYYRGVRELYLAINTHPDTDHLQGLEAVLKEIPARYIAIPATMVDTEEYRNLRKIAKAGKMPIIPIAGGEPVYTGEKLQIQVLYPPAKAKSLDNANEQSIVMDVRYDGFSTLLTGDIGLESMQELIKNEQLKAPVTVLKIPHHGSRMSLLPVFYDKAKPEWAVISVGANNIFGHPHPLILEALEDKHIKVIRTDIDGAVTFCSDGRRVRLKTGRGNGSLFFPVY
ncbi:MAG: DNA internalization-related competence protein ComEC/Rec2 [Syntrophomonadaceae bacterium]|nr:DNA internalization-related competence protein ComEC/Rec2 [Syntrophomonadaceae bacterium]